MVAVALGGGLAWRQTQAKEVENFLPSLQADSNSTNLLGNGNLISGAIDAIQDGIKSIKAQVDKSASLLTAFRDSATKDTESVGEQTHDEHLRKYGGRLLGGSECDRAKKAFSAQETLVRQVTVLDGCLDGGQYLPVFYILKDELLLSPVNISLTMGFTAMPFILKPGLAIASDRLPIFGRKRTPYLAGSMVIVAGTYVGASLVESYGSILGFLSLNTFGRCLMSAVLQGMVVEVAREDGREDVSAVVGDFFGQKTCAALFSALFSSMLIGNLSSRSVLRLCACAPLLMLAGIGRCEQEGGELAFVLSDEQTRAWAAQNSSIPAVPSESRLNELLQCISNPTLWGPLLFLVVYSAGPGYDDSLYFFYINRLRFRPRAVGRLKMAQELAKFIGILVYRYALRSIPDRQLVVGLTAVSLPLYLTPLLLTTGAYHHIPLSPQTLAVSGELVREVVLHIQFLPVFARFADLGPRGLESTSVSLLYAMLQSSRAMNKVTSAGMSHLLGVTAHNFHHLSLLIMVCGACATLPLPLAKYIPEDTEAEVSNENPDLCPESTELLVPSGWNREEEQLDVRLPAACETCGQRCARESPAAPAG